MPLSPPPQPAQSTQSAQSGWRALGTPWPEAEWPEILILRDVFTPYYILSMYYGVRLGVPNNGPGPREKKRHVIIQPSR